MQCPHCGQPQHGVCLKCDKHYFQVGVTIHNDSAIAALKERKELADKNNAEVKKLKKKIGRLEIFIAIILAVFLLYGGWCNKREEPRPAPERDSAITRPIPF